MGHIDRVCLAGQVERKLVGATPELQRLKRDEVYRYHLSRLVIRNYVVAQNIRGIQVQGLWRELWLRMHSVFILEQSTKMRIISNQY